MEFTINLFLPRDAASVPVSRQVLDKCLEILGVTPDTRTDIALALDEACANVIVHAGPGAEYEVRATAHGGRCVIEVVNTSDGVTVAAPSPEPVPVTAESGRGLKIIDAVTDNLRLSNGRDGTTVHFEKELAWLPNALGEALVNGKPLPGTR